MEEEEIDHAEVAALAYERNLGSLIYRLPRELLLKILAMLVLDSGKSFRRVQRSARVFTVSPSDGLFWEALCREYHPNYLEHIHKYPTWHAMFVQRPQLRFDGVYVCTSTYMRRVEQKASTWLQPLVEVTYYRYIRLFRDGSAHAFVTPKEPERVLPFEDHNEASKGEWRADYDRNVLVVRVGIHKTENNLHMAFRVASENGRLHNTLQWRVMEINRRGQREWDPLPHTREGQFHFEKITTSAA